MKENNILEPEKLITDELSVEIETEAPEIPRNCEPKCGESYGDVGCPGDTIVDFITCEECRMELEDGEQHDCSGRDEPSEIEEEPTKEKN